MARLTVFQEGRQVGDYELSGERLVLGLDDLSGEVLVGSLDACARVSIERRGDRWTFEDTRNEGDLRANGEPAERTGLLTSGDRLEFGPVELHFIEQKELRPSRRTLLAESGVGAPHLVWRAERGQEVLVALSEEAVTIGTSEDATLQLPGGMLSGRVYARVVPFGNGHALEPAAWWCRVELNGQRVKARQTLQEGDVVRIGTSELRYLGRPMS